MTVIQIKTREKRMINQTKIRKNNKLDENT